MVYCNRVGYEDGLNYGGGSEIVNPWGERITPECILDEELLIGEVDMRDVRRARGITPLLRDEDLHLTLSELKRIIGKRASGGQGT